MSTSTAKPEYLAGNTDKRLLVLDQVLAGQDKLLVVLHNNPDPDAIASGLALGYLAEKRYGVQSSIAYGGLIGRAENHAMVRELRIRLKKMSRIRLQTYDRVAIVDAQPGAGNHALPSDVACHIVIDHHPGRRGVRASLLIVEPGIGATATIMVELLSAAELPIQSDLATALAYAIRTETQELGRETSARDIRAYLKVYPPSSMRKMARITHPKLPRSYFVMLERALNRAMSFRNLICAHLGEVSTPEIVGEMADMLLRHQRIGWSLCSGRYRGALYISMRSSSPKAEAGRLIKRLVPSGRDAGGHGTFAGGKIASSSGREEDISREEEKLSRNFARLFGHDDVEWRPLLE